MMSSLRMRLFNDVIDSPVTTSGPCWDESEIEAVLTPCGLAKKSTDSGFLSGLALSINIPSLEHLPASTGIRRSLFSGKRLADHDEEDDSPVTKKAKTADTASNCCSNQASVCYSTIIDAVDRLTTEHNLVADGTRDYCLPTIPGKHSDLKSISCDTMVDLLAGRYSDQLGEVTIVDCRYPYEFEGGHINGAVNMFTKDAVQSLLRVPLTSEKKHVMIFHCEFSSERGPKMYRFLRSQDRELNKDSYPAHSDHLSPLLRIRPRK